MIDRFKDFLAEGITDYLPEFFEFLKKQPDDVVVHFTNWFRVGINPKPNHQDPVGVYTFPKEYVLSPDFNRNSHFFSMKYAFILKPKGGRVLNLSTITLPEVEGLIKKMGLTIIDPTGSGHHSLRNHDTAKPGHVLWDTMEKSIAVVRSQKNIQWNKWFKKAGVDILIDDGDSIIHSNEPFQVVFLSPGTYETITYFQHNAEDTYKKLAIQIMNTISKELFDDEKYTMRVKNEKSYRATIYMNGLYNGNPVQIWGVHYKNERDKIDQPLSMKINLASHLGKNVHFDTGDDTNRVEVHFNPDKPSSWDQIWDVVRVFKSKMDEPGFFRADKGQYTEALAKEIMNVLGLKGTLEKGNESQNFRKRIKGFGIFGIYVDYYKNEEEPHYHLSMSLKPEKSDSYHTQPMLYGSDKAIIAAHYVEEGIIKFAAEKLIRKTLNYWKEAQERSYPTDYDKYKGSDWTAHEKMKTGQLWQKFFAWIEDKLTK